MPFFEFKFWTPLFSQAQLAEKLGIRQNMISDYERGKRRLSPEMAKRMAKILHIKVDRIS
jgi:transcriptional regulator with XRE-family HTH domain